MTASWQTVELSETDPPEVTARKMAEAMARVHEHLAPVMIRFRDEPYVMIVPPDAGLAWARAQESQRLSRIATDAAGLGQAFGGPPGADVEPGH
jgi:hypothetical protein